MRSPSAAALDCFGGELAEAQGAVAIFDCSNGNPSPRIARAPVLSLSVSGDGKTMAVGGEDCHRRNPWQTPPPQGPKNGSVVREPAGAGRARADRDEGPNLLKLVLTSSFFLSFWRQFLPSLRWRRAPAPAPDAMDTSSDQPSQPAAQQALERAKRIAETCGATRRWCCVVSRRAHGPRVARASCRPAPRARRTRRPPRRCPAGLHAACVLCCHAVTGARAAYAPQIEMPVRWSRAP